MHSHLELIIPPVEDIPSFVDKLLDPFYLDAAWGWRISDEGLPPEREDAFLDGFKIGGRFFQSKLLGNVDRHRLAHFIVQLDKLELPFTVKKFKNIDMDCLTNERDKEVADSLWKEFFPNSLIKKCPFFDYSHPYYTEKDYSGFPPGVVLRLDQISDGMRAARVMIANPINVKSPISQKEYFIHTCSGEHPSALPESKYWDGTILSALKFCDYIIPQPDWLVITIDYHS